MSGLKKVPGNGPLNPTPTAESLSQIGSTAASSSKPLGGELPAQLGKAPGTSMGTSQDTRRTALLPTRTGVPQALQAATGWATTAGTATGALAASSGEDPHQSNLDTVHAALANAGLVNHVKVTKKPAKTAMPVSGLSHLGINHSTLFAEFSRWNDCPAEAFPTDPKKLKSYKLSKKQAMNDAIRAVNDINKKIEEISNVAQEKLALLRKAIQKDSGRRQLLGITTGTVQFITAATKEHAEFHEATNDLKAYTESLAIQFKRLSAFPDMDNGKRNQFKDALQKGIGLASRIQFFSLQASPPDSPMLRLQSVKSSILNRLNAGETPNHACVDIARAAEKEIDHDQIWRNSAFFVEILKLNDALPPGHAQKFSNAERSKLLLLGFTNLTHACEAQFSLMDTRPRYRVMELSDLIDISQTAAMRKQLNEDLLLQQQQQHVLASPDAPGAVVLGQEIARLKQMAAAEINKISRSFRPLTVMNSDTGFHGRSQTTSKQCHEIKTAMDAAARLDEIDLAFAHLASDAEQLLGTEKGKAPQAQLDQVQAGLDLGRFIAQTMATIGRALAQPAKPAARGQPAAEVSAPVAAASSAQAAEQTAGPLPPQEKASKQDKAKQKKAAKSVDKTAASALESAEVGAPALITQSPAKPAPKAEPAAESVTEPAALPPTETAPAATAPPLSYKSALLAAVPPKTLTTAAASGTTPSASAQDFDEPQWTSRQAQRLAGQHVAPMATAAAQGTFAQINAAIQHDIAPKLELAQAAMTAGKNELGSHQHVLRAFRTHELTGPATLDAAVAHFKQAAQQYDEAMAALESRVPDKNKAVVQPQLMALSQKFEMARQHIQETVEFRNSPLSKKPTEEVMAQLHKSGLIRIQPPSYVLSEGGAFVAVQIDIAPKVAKNKNNYLSLHMHLKERFSGTAEMGLEDLKKLRKGDFVVLDAAAQARQPDRQPISVKNEFYDSMQSNRDREGNPTPRMPWQIDFAFNVLQQSLERHADIA